MKFLTKQKAIDKIFIYASYLLYGLALIFICLTFANSKSNGDEVLYPEIHLAFSIAFLSASLLSLLTGLTIKLVLYFKKRKTVEVEKGDERVVYQTIQKPLSVDYYASFLRSLVKNKKDLLFLFLHSLYFPCYAVIIYFQRFEDKMKYFYPVLIAGLFIFVMFICYLFIVPVNERRKRKKDEGQLVISNQDFILTGPSNDTVITFDMFFRAYKSKNAFVFLSEKEGFDVLIDKKLLNTETCAFLEKLVDAVKNYTSIW